jgi:hypothetical protein
VIFGSVTGRDPRSLGRTGARRSSSACRGSRTKALQQVAFDQLAATGAAKAAEPALTKPGAPQRCVATR